MSRLSQLLLCAVMWMLTRVKPNTKVNELRCCYVDELHMEISNARHRHREQNPTADDHCLKTLLSMRKPWQEDIVMQHAKELGYDEAWGKAYIKKSYQTLQARERHCRRRESDAILKVRRELKKKGRSDEFNLEQQHTDPCPESH